MNSRVAALLHVACMALALPGMPAHAEVAELNVAQQYGVSFIPLFFPEIHDLPGS